MPEQPDRDHGRREPRTETAGSRPGGGELSPEQSRRKHRLERWAALLVAGGFLFLTLLQREIIDLGPGLNRSQGLVALVSINLSVVLMVLLILLILRGLYNIFFEKRGYGSLQTKMVVAFICLSLLPTLLIFYYSYRQLVHGHNLWFSPKIEAALKDSISLTEAALVMDNLLLAGYGGDILNELGDPVPPLTPADLENFLKRARDRLHLAGAEIYRPDGRLLAAAESGRAAPPPLPAGWFAGRIGEPQPWINTSTIPAGYLIRLVWPLPGDGPEAAGSNRPAFLALGRLTLAPIHSQITEVRNALVSYQDALNVQKPFRVTQLTALTAVTLLAVFISVWIGSHLAGALARPVLALVTGTQRVAAGDWDFRLEPQGRSGEFAELVASFNRMTGNLKEMYVELDSRRRFLETVLENVSTGVVVLDQTGRVTSLNRAAAGIL
ncbi:MAG: HAMP domain-containing protein, partial [Candidatus Adiutrix sp.]|nr:HAMP domain-containing protein [Candidatus Adiutrix sp.]